MYTNIGTTPHSFLDQVRTLINKSHFFLGVSTFRGSNLWKKCPNKWWIPPPRYLFNQSKIKLGLNKFVNQFVEIIFFQGAGVEHFRDKLIYSGGVIFVRSGLFKKNNLGPSGVHVLFIAKRSGHY